MNKLFSWFRGLFSDAFKSFLKAVFTQAKAKAVTVLKDVAMRAVLEAQATGLDSESKRKMVFDSIKDYAKVKGIDAKDSIINLTLELAVAAVKK